MRTFAFDIKGVNSDGKMIYYNYINNGTELEVTSGSYYKGDINIPEKVTYMDKVLNVTSIGKNAFENCSSLISVNIGNSVTAIENQAFYGCYSLTSVTIGNSVKGIDSMAFYCEYGGNLTTVVSLITEPFGIQSDVFSSNTLRKATLYVPAGTIDKYKATDGWKEFLFIEEGTGNEGQSTPEKCEKPTIAYANGKLTFTSNTEGATCQYTITDADIKSGSGNEVQLMVTYNISVYATKAGCENSETATATLCWVDLQPATEGIANNISQIPARAMLIQSQDGVLTIHGVDDGSNIDVYTVSGQMVASTKAHGNQALIATNLRKGEVAIIKTGENAVKVMMR